MTAAVPSAVVPLWGAATWVAGTEATPSPEPTLRQGVDPVDVTPGVLGFVVVFAVALACIPLFRSMTGKIRRVERADAERQAEDRPEEPQAP